MKKRYEKPQAEIEQFQLSERIASCDAGSDYSDVLNEAWIQGFGYFTSGSCNVEAPEGEDLPGVGDVKYCYHTSAEGSTLFSS